MKISQEPIIDLNAWERDIPKLLSEVFLDNELYNPVVTNISATQLIKQTIGKYGQDRWGFDVCANGFADANCDREWLWDMVWYKMDDTGRTVSVPLVLESEMSLAWHAINYDFEKLLAANADLRVLVCCTTKKDDESIKAEIDLYIKHFAESIQRYQQLPIGSRFLILMWEHYQWGGLYGYSLCKSLTGCNILATYPIDSQAERS